MSLVSSTSKYLYKSIFVLLVFLFVGLFLFPSVSVLAQINEVSVNVQVLPPYSNNIYDYIGSNEKITRSFQEQILVTLRNNNPNRTYEVKLIASVSGNNGIEARINPNYQPFQRIVLPAGEMRIISGRELAQINRNLNENDITSQGINSQQIRRTGNLPEGSYRICFQAVDFRNGQVLSSNEPFGCSPPITISNPDPPVIAYPFNDAVILATNPQTLNISWAPVPNADPRLRYRIKIVELNEINANPYDLMEQTNVAYYQEENLMINNIFYDQTKPQLKAGYTYAIRVQAYDPIGQIQIKNNGLSEITLFRYANSYDDGSGLADLDFINLVPGYLQLTNLQQLTSTSAAGTERFNGQAQLRIVNPITEVEELVAVTVSNLSMESGNRQTPKFLSGSVSGNLNTLPDLFQNLEGLVVPNAIGWNYQDGATLSGEASLADGTKVRVSGKVQLTPGGVVGQLRAGNQQTPIYEIDEEQVRLKITEVIASFPDKTLKGNGYLEILDQQIDSLKEGPCEISGINLLQNEVAINVNCTYDESIPLAKDSDKVMLRFNSIYGVVIANWQNTSLDFDIKALGVVDIKSDDDTYNCGINMALILSNDKPLSFNVLGNNCALANRSLSLGIVQLNLRDIMLTEISYLQGNWDFQLTMNGDFIIPMFDYWTSPEVKDIIIDKQGITISAQDWSLSELQGLQQIGWDSTVTISPNQIKFDAITYPWYQEIEQGKEPWNFMSQGKADVYNLPIIPCLSDYEYDYRLYYNSEDGVYGEITGEGEGCSYNFGMESSITLTKLKGELFADLEEQETIKSATLSLTGSLKNEFLFQCLEEPDFNNVFLTVDRDFVRGSITQFVPECPVNIGPFSAKITSSTLQFEVRDGTQEVLLDASADLYMPDSTKVKGTFIYDLVNSEFIEIEFRLDNPFTWNVPADDPVMSFYIQEAVINKEGFMIDGRNTLKLPDARDISATFDRLLLDINSMRIKNGQIIFDESFAFEAGIDTATYDLNFKAIESGTDLSLNPAIYFDLGPQVIIDSTGLKTGGDALAKLKFRDQNFGEDLSINFSEDFALSLYPFKVGSGRADFLMKEQLIAYIDEQGISLDPTDFVLNALPAKIPLPDNSIAYLQIRDANNQLLVDVEKLPNGNVKIETLPAKNLSFFLPAVNATNPPVLGNVQLIDVVLSPNLSRPEIVSGTVLVSVPENSPSLTSLELPIKIKEIAFGKNLFGSKYTGLFLSGDLKLFDTELPEAGNVFLYVQNDGLAMATFNLSNTDLSIPLVPNSNLVTYQLNSLQGDFAGYLDNLAAQNFQLDVLGKFSINNQQTVVASADLGLQIAPGSFQVTSFDASLNENPIDLDFGDFGLKIKEIPSIPVFSYSAANGFDFAAELNLAFYMDLAGGERFELPLDGLEIRKSGLHIPPQNINAGSIPGLSVPSVNIAGFGLELLALRTTQASIFDWYNLSEWHFNPSLDIAVRMPELATKGLKLPDGLSFYNLSINKGIFSGTMSPFTPLGGLNVKLSDLPEAPTLKIAKITGALLPDSISGLQDFNIELEGQLSDLPGFENTEAQACGNPSFSLSIKEGRAFEGTINNFTPCGYLTIAPFTLTPQSSTLLFAYAGGVQELSLDGTVRLDLADSPSPNGLADGNLKLNLLTGKMMNGYVEINKSFQFGLPVDDPLFNFSLSAARLDTSGFTMKGAGSLAMGNINNTIAFNDLKLSLEDLRIKSGSANLGSNLNLDMRLNPFGLQIEDFNAQKPAEDHLRMSLDADVILNKDGINYSGKSIAAIRFAGQDYPALRAEFVNNFALNINSLAVSNGQAEFYLDQNGQQAAEPLAILDANGFSMGGGIVAALPDTLALPTKDVAYIILKDAQGNSLVNASQNISNGWDIGTKNNQPLTLVVPALANGQTAPEVLVTFALTTDSNYQPNGGSISLDSNLDLEPNFQLPIEITSIALITGSRTALSLGVAVALPTSLSEAPVSGDFVVDQNGFQQASLEWGNYTTTYNSSLVAAFSSTAQGTLPNDNQSTNTTLDLYGIKVQLGANKSLKISGGVSSDIISRPNETPQPLFFYADYSNQSWNGGVDVSHFADGLAIGQLSFTPETQQPFTLAITNQQFLISANGIIDFEPLLGEPLQVSVQDLQLGVDYSQADPQPIFGLAGGSITLPDQDIDLFGGEVGLLLQNPSFEINGREIIISSAGELDVFDENIDFTGMRVSSINGFNLGTVQLQTDIELIPEYAKLTALSLSQNQYNLSLEAALEVSLPEPVESTAVAAITISRDNNKQVNVAVDGPDFEINKRIAIGTIAEFELTKVAIDIKPSRMSESGIYATGKLYIEDTPRVFFGNESAIRTNPGIAYANQTLRYNATGNASFSIDEGFFNITVLANMTVSNATKFEVMLGGTAGVTIQGVGGTLDYENFTIGPDGITDRGNLAGSGSLTLMDIASLTIGRFQYEVPKDGEATVMVDLPIENPDPGSFDSGSEEVQFKATAVKRFLRFGGGMSGGPALELTLGGSNSAEGGSGGFSGGVDEVVFYELPDGKKYLKIDNANLAIGETLTCNAYLKYQQSAGGFELQVAASAQVGIAGNTVAAGLAGYFAKANDDLRFGLFVGIASSTGIPLFPGVVTLTGGGAGFFYQPTQSDINLVTKQGGPLEALGHKMVRNQLSNPFNPPPLKDIKFAVMLFAKVGILGQAGQYSLEGSTYIQITNKSVLMDAYGVVLGLDGNGATKLKLQGGAYVQASFDNFFIDGGGFVDLNMPLVLEGRMELAFFFAENPNIEGEVIWAIDGDLAVTVYSVLNMDGTIIACPSGIFMEAGLGVKFDKLGFKVDADFRGSVWYANDNSFQYPFGAYLRAGVDLCFLGACAKPEAKAAFATVRGGGFELVVGAQACLNIPLKGETCAHGMASKVYGKSFDVSFGWGKMESALFDEAEGMKGRFEQMIDDLRNEINTTKDAVENFVPEVPPLEIPTEVLTAAGYNWHTAEFARFIGASSLMLNMNRITGNNLPNNLQWVLDNIMAGGSNSDFDVERVTKFGDVYDEVRNQKRLMLNKMDTSVLFLEEAIVRASRTVGNAYEYKKNAQEAFDAMMDALDSSPVLNTDFTVELDTGRKITKAPSFQINKDKARQQNEQSSLAEGLSDQLQNEFERAILATEKNLNALDSMLTYRLQKSGVQQNNNTGNGTVTYSINNTQAIAGNVLATNNSTVYQSELFTMVSQQNNSNAAINASLSANNQLPPEYLPSIADVSEGLRETVEAIERYYAYEGSFRARQYDWMNFALAALKQKEMQIKNTLGGLYASNSAKTDVFLEKNMKDRIEIIYDLAQAPSQAKQNKLNTTELSPQNFLISLENAWYDIHELGLEDAKDNIAFSVMRDLRQDKSDALAIINTPYNSLSNKVDEAYTLKSEIMALLHGLYQQYNKVIEATDTSGNAQQLSNLSQQVEDRLTSIENDLIPPSINNINLLARTDFFRNKATVDWVSSTRPIETAVQVAPYGDNTVATGFYGYQSIGDKRKFNIYSYKNAFTRQTGQQNIAYSETKQLSVGIRLRSAGGVTSIRRAEFNVAVGPTSPTAQFQWNGIKESDNTPPSIQYVTFFPYDKTPYPDTESATGEAYFTDEKESFYLQVGARDDESDVVKFEYAVGSNRGGNDIKDWTQLTGDRARNIWDNSGGNNNEPDDYLTTEQIGVVNNLSLQLGERYYFSVKVTNGEGLTKIRKLQNPLAYDETAPTTPSEYRALSLSDFYNANNSSEASGNYLSVQTNNNNSNVAAQFQTNNNNLTYTGTATAYINYNVPVNPVRIKPLANSTPAFQSFWLDYAQIFNRVKNNPLDPEINFRWNASQDYESGIKEYHYYISKDSILNEDKLTGQTTTTSTSEKIKATTTNKNTSLSAVEPFVTKYLSTVEDFGNHFIFVRAHNNADNVSDVARLGPFFAIDPTAPDVPDMQVTERTNHLRINIIKHSFDPESNLKGYQYAIGTSPNLISLRNFPQNGQVDWELNNYGAIMTRPTYDIDKTNLPQGEPIYVFFRALNQQGMPSATVACGPIYIDDTPPLSPTINLSKGFLGAIDIDLTNVQDPESGIKKVSYRVSWTENGQSKNSGYINAYEPQTIARTDQSLSFSRSAGNYDENSVKVEVWVYNGRGEYTYASKVMTTLQLLGPSSGVSSQQLQFIGTW